MNDPHPFPPRAPRGPLADAAGADAAELARLKREIAARDDILSIAAHELRNPLHALALHLALARNMAEAGAAAEAADRVRRAEQTLRRYSERVTVLMELLASPGAVYPLAPRAIEPMGLLESLVDSLDQEARSRGIAVSVVAGDARAAATRALDPVAFEQVVDNLLLNAFKHSGCDRIEVLARTVPGEFMVEVNDNGRGIEAEDQAAIFEKFAVARHSTRGTGTGLGLWIVTRLVQAMGGTISLRSRPGAGCRFTIRIPDRGLTSTTR
ncbi:MAG TPA: HAMP domain-containing sensor histidine kinase [Burkholderiaceae bacterium]